jgi:hypothetical protein
MFSVSTNIHNKKTTGPTLMESFTATGKLKKFFTTRDVRCVHHGWQGTHRYSSLLKWSVLIIQRGHMAMVLCALFTKCTLHSNHSLLCDTPTHETTFPSERPFSHYIHSHRLATEMWTTMKNNFLVKNNLVVPSTCTGFINTCPTAFLS